MTLRARGRGRRVGSPAHALAHPHRPAPHPPALREIAGDPTRRPRPRVPDVTIDRVSVAAYRIPTSSPEFDGTLEWNATTLVVVEVEGGGRRGLGYTYA